MDDGKASVDYINEIRESHPELLPKGIEDGLKLHGFVRSKKQEGFRMRRIRLKNRDSYRIRPSFMMLYMIAKTEEIEIALCLRHWGVPFEAPAYVFGLDAMYR